MSSIFHNAWWLDAVAPRAWEEIKIMRGSDSVVRMPIYKTKKYGMTLLTMPSLTQTLGPVLNIPTEDYTKQLSEEKKWLNELIDQLPPCDYFAQRFHYSITNWLPFYWAGYSQTTRYTYVLDNLEDPEALYFRFRSSVKRQIKKAERNLAVRTDLGINDFIKLNQLTFERQGLTMPYSSQLVKRLDEACRKNNARKMFFAEDENGRLHSALYIIWDEDSAYYLMGGSDPELRNSGATSLLMWEAIQFSAGVTKRFDFEGSMIEPIENFVRGFGPKQIPYFYITKMSRRMKMLKQGRDWFKRTSLLAAPQIFADPIWGIFGCAV